VPESPTVELDPNRWRALAVGISALFLTLLDISTVNVALPSIGRGTGAGTAELQWVISGYILAFGMVPIIGGRLGDDHGRRRMLEIAIAGFVLSSAVVGLAPSAAVLVGARLVQGLAGGLINPQLVGFVQQLFPLSERGLAFGYVGSAVGIATATGPTVGGLVIGLGGDHWGWRLTFLINVPIGLTALVLVRRWLPDAPRAAHPRPLDLPGAALLAAGLFCVLFPIVQYDSHHDARLALAFIPAFVLLTLFLAWERGPGRRRGYPLIDVGLFRVPSYADGLSLALLFFVSYAGIALVLSLFLQDGLGFSPPQAGLTAGAYAIGSAVSAPFAGRLVPKLGRALLIGALLVFTAGVVAMAILARFAGSPGDRFALALAPALLVAGIGGGSVITPNQALSLAEVDTRGGSTAGGMLQTSQRIGAALGAALTSAVFYAAARGAPASGPARSEHYAHAYATALLVTVGFALAALAIAVRDVRRARLRVARLPVRSATSVTDVAIGSRGTQSDLRIRRVGQKIGPPVGDRPDVTASGPPASSRRRRLCMA
jgi:EmrB/QacA subfamily drug resistance transporter